MISSFQNHHQQRPRLHCSQPITDTFFTCLLSANHRHTCFTCLLSANHRHTCFTCLLSANHRHTCFTCLLSANHRHTCFTCLLSANHRQTCFVTCLLSANHRQTCCTCLCLSSRLTGEAHPGGSRPDPHPRLPPKGKRHHHGPEPLPVRWEQRPHQSGLHSAGPSVPQLTGHSPQLMDGETLKCCSFMLGTIFSF